MYTDLSIVRIQETNFTNNTAIFGDGSCIYSKRMIIILGECPIFTFEELRNKFGNDTNYLYSIKDCLFDSNQAYRESGGAIYIGIDYDKDLLLDDISCFSFDVLALL